MVPCHKAQLYPMKTGIIGLGAMGTGMAWNLHRAHVLHAVWNRSLDKAADIAARTGVQQAETSAALAAQCELILISLSQDDAVLEQIEQICMGLHPGTIVADTSTISSDTARQAGRQIAAAGGHFLDCPVSGGVEGARQGTLSMMVGGAAEHLERCHTVLQHTAETIIHMGGQGCGQAAKAVNQIMVAGINQAVSEAMAFAQATGLDIDKLMPALSKGAAGNWFLDHRGRSMVAGDFTPGFKLALHCKDLDICADILSGLGESGKLPVLELSRQQYRQLMEAGYGNEDISTLLRLKREALNV